MVNILIRICLLQLSLVIFWQTSTAQLKVGNNPRLLHPSAMLEVESTNKGLLPPRLTMSQRDSIILPATGLMIFNITANCLQINQGTPQSPVWFCLTPLSGQITAINCINPANTGRLFDKVQATGVSSTIAYTGGDGNGYPSQQIVSTGITGLTANLPAGNFRIGNGSLTFQITGAASGPGTASFLINIGGQQCTLQLPVLALAGLPLGSGVLYGRDEFDVAISNDNTNGCEALVYRIPYKADFTQPATYIQPYTFIPSGTVSNVRFLFINHNGPVISSVGEGDLGNNINTPVTALVHFNTGLNELAAGRNFSNPLKATLIVLYNDSPSGDGSDKQVFFHIIVTDCQLPVSKPVSD